MAHGSVAGRDRMRDGAPQSGVTLPVLPGVVPGGRGAPIECSDERRMRASRVHHRGDNEMKVLVAYMSKTGNTKKVAEAIYQELDGEKAILPVEQVVDTSGYDLTFLGFPVQRFGPDPKTVGLLRKHCQPGRDVALFITHAAPEEEPELGEWLDKFRAAASAANIVGVFDCQGQLAQGVKRMMLLLPVRRLRSMAKRDNSQGQPDAARLARARGFAREMQAKMRGEARG
ncbi:MAG: flavodoxin [Clostridiales bacterium]|nr:flavodoxin [Clostridiales bacterium]